MRKLLLRNLSLFENLALLVDQIHLSGILHFHLKSLWTLLPELLLLLLELLIEFFKIEFARHRYSGDARGWVVIAVVTAAAVERESAIDSC